MTTYTLSDLADHLKAELQGDAAREIRGIAPLARAQAGDISFLSDARYRKQLEVTQASAVLLSKEHATDCPTDALILPNPQLGFVRLIHLFYPPKPVEAGVHPTAIIGQGVQLGEQVSVGPYAVIGNGATVGPNTVIGAGATIGDGTSVGSNCHLYANVSLYHDLRIGDRVIIHSGAVIGADGFGLAQDEQKNWVKVPQIGRVVIGDGVEIGANTAIDRGALEDTVIGNGVKLDDQVMIGHNVQIGDHTAIAGCAGVAGSTRIGQRCLIGGGACINGHIEIVDGVMITGMGMINKSISQPGIYSSGTGMQSNREWHKSVARFHQLNDIAKRLQRLEKESHE